MFVPYQQNHFLYDPYYLLGRGEKRTENMMYVSITCGPGRTIKQKRDLYQSISLRVSECSSIKVQTFLLHLTRQPLKIGRLVKDWRNW